jgi:16S rRNA (cytidine1402-2'-O)-methyltransferase
VLYVCATPIGNLEDVTLRVLEVLGRVEIVACEDTRHTRRLLDRHGLRPPRLLSFHEHNEAARLDEVLAVVRAGLDVALVSDAGMPGVSDPGYTLVRACVDEGLPLTVLPGASAVSTALVVSGLPTDRFTFVGFLPRGRQRVLDALETAGATGGSVVAFESPRRVRGTLEAVAARWPARSVAVCRELTKAYEQVLRGTAVDVLALLAEEPKGEIVLVLGPPPNREPVASADVDGALRVLLRHGLGTKEAAGVVATLAGLPARDAYRAALAVRRAHPGGLVE